MGKLVSQKGEKSVFAPAPEVSGPAMQNSLRCERNKNSGIKAAEQHKGAPVASRLSERPQIGQRHSDVGLVQCAGSGLRSSEQFGGTCRFEAQINTEY